MTVRSFGLAEFLAVRLVCVLGVAVVAALANLR